MHLFETFNTVGHGLTSRVTVVGSSSRLSSPLHTPNDYTEPHPYTYSVMQSQ